MGGTSTRGVLLKWNQFFLSMLSLVNSNISTFKWIKLAQILLCNSLPNNILISKASSLIFFPFFLGWGGGGLNTDIHGTVYIFTS